MERPDPQPLDDILEANLDVLGGDSESKIADLVAQHPERERELRDAAAALRALRDVGLKSPHLPPPARVLPRKEAGQMLGRFEILRELGRGGIGVVYAARDPKLGRVVAVKTLTTTPTAEAMERFRREAQALAQVRHPNIVALHEIGESDQGVPYLVMDLVEGRSLESVLTTLRDRQSRDLKPQDLPWEASGNAPSYVNAVVRLASKVADALDHAHRIGVVHRDVKPANILLDERGEPHLIDFGLARGLDALGMTRTGSAPGTPQFMAPEQIDPSTGQIGPHTDVYALGVTIYCCLTLRAPFQGETTQQLFHAICRRDPAPLRKLNPAIPRDVETVVMKAIEKAPLRRYPNAAELRDDLHALLAMKPIRARPPGPIVWFGKWMRRNPAAAAALSIMMVFGIASWVWRILDLRAQGVAAFAKFEQEWSSVEVRAAELAPRIAALGGFLSIETRGTIAAEENGLEKHRRGAEQTLDGAIGSFQRARRALGPFRAVDLGIRRRLFDALVRRAEISKEHGNEVDADQHLTQSLELAGDDAAAWYSGKVWITAYAPGAVAYLFRYQPYERAREYAIPRLVPVPIEVDGDLLPLALEWEAGPDFRQATDVVVGDECVILTRVLPGGIAERSGLAAGDSLHYIGRHAVRARPLFVERTHPGGVAERAGVRAFDRVQDVDGKPMHSLWAWENLPRAADPPATRVHCRVEIIGGESVILDGGRDFGLLPERLDPELLPTCTRGLRAGIDGYEGLESSLGLEVAEAQDLIARGRPVSNLVLRCVRSGRVVEIVWPEGEPFGAECELTAYPLILSDRNRVDLEEPRMLDLPPGSYLALVQAPERSDLRLPFVVQPGGEIALEATLLRPEDIPDGFVFVPAGPFVFQGDPDVTLPQPAQTVHLDGFFIARFEVTMGEWLEFLNSEGDFQAPENLTNKQLWSNADAQPPVELYMLPRHPNGTAFCSIQGGRWYAHRQADDCSPVVGLPDGWIDRFLAWLNRRAAGTGWRYELATVMQWEKAARGVDGRSYPWGDRFDATLCNSETARDAHQAIRLHLEPCGRFASDESPYGIRDMAGGAVELNQGPAHPTRRAWTPKRGGSWALANSIFFRAASQAPSDVRMPQDGFRLVAVRE